MRGDRQQKSFFFNDTATTEIYTLSLHDALPISLRVIRMLASTTSGTGKSRPSHRHGRSEEHTSELQSRLHLVCRLLLEKKHITLFSVRDCDAVHTGYIYSLVSLLKKFEIVVKIYFF